MLNNVTIGQYIPGKSILHKMDPRIKVIILLIHMIVTFSVDGFFAYGILYLLTVGGIFLSRVPVKYTLKGIKTILFLCCFSLIVNLFTVNTGTELITILGRTIYSDSLIFSGKVFSRLILLVLTASLLTLTTTPILLTDGIEKLLKPIGILGVSAHDIAMIMTIALRFIPTLVEETDRIMKAQASRGADFDTGNIIQRAKSFIPVIIPLLISAFKRAYDLADAMEARCYRGGEGRTRLRQLKIVRRDVIALIVFVIFCGAACILPVILNIRI